MPPKRKVSDDNNSAKPKRRREAISLSDDMKIIDPLIKEKKLAECSIRTNHQFVKQ
jgi:hypothetical protein